MDPTLMSYIEKAIDVSDMVKSRQGFLNVHPEEEPNLFWIIVAYKCYFAAYATCDIYFSYLIYTVMIGMYINTFIYGNIWSFPIMAFNIGLLSTYDLGMWQYTLQVVCWFLTTVIADFQLLLDIFILIAILKYVLSDLYDGLEGFVFVIVTAVVNWWIDRYLGFLPLNLNEMCWPLLILASFYILIKPCRTWPYSAKQYIYACIGVYMFLLIKFIRIWSAYGFHEDPLSFPYERYIPSFTLMHIFIDGADDREHSVIKEYFYDSIFNPDKEIHPLIYDLIFNLTVVEIRPPLPAVEI